MSNYSKIEKCDFSNGEGVRVSVFFSGCPHTCSECHNKIAWNKNHGEEYTRDTELYVLNLCEDDFISGLSLLGGEPLADYNYDTVLELCKNFKESYPNKNIWIWTGYTVKELKNQNKLEILKYIDTIIDGRFEKDLFEPDLKFKGSSNQTVYDVKNGDFYVSDKNSRTW